MPDDQLNENDKKEKKKQRFLKNIMEARDRARQLREEEKARLMEEERLEERRRLEDPVGWLETLMSDRSVRPSSYSAIVS